MHASADWDRELALVSVREVGVFIAEWDWGSSPTIRLSVVKRVVNGFTTVFSTCKVCSKRVYYSFYCRCFFTTHSCTQGMYLNLCFHARESGGLERGRRWCQEQLLRAATQRPTPRSRTCTPFSRCPPLHRFTPRGFAGTCGWHLRPCSPQFRSTFLGLPAPRSTSVPPQR